MIVAKSKEMLAIDKKTIGEYKVPGIILMEHAAMKVVEWIPKEANRVVAVCGTGNNGGDGLAIARLLYLQGKSVTVILVGNEDSLKADARVMYDSLSGLGISCIWYSEDKNEAIKSEMMCADLIVDAVFGIGCNRLIKGDYYKVIQMINDARTYVVSVDIPSGINSDNGKIMGVSVKAQMTVTFTLPKLGNLLYPGAMATEQLRVVDIGIPQEVLEQYSFSYETLDEATMAYMPGRLPVSHKMTYGKLLVIAGSNGMSGAAYLAAKAAYRTGCGLVEIITHESCRRELHSLIPEAIITTYTDDFESVQSLIEGLAVKLDGYDGILIGPGLSKGESAIRLMAFVMTQPSLPLVIDADGLNILADDLELLEQATVPIVITPHIGEMARLTKYPSSAILENTVEFAQAFAKANNIVVALKSNRTIVTNREGLTGINVCGNDGMATAGSGDVLAGVIISLIGQGLEPFKSACVGVALHSLAGDVAASKMGTYSLMARDIIDGIPAVLRRK